MWPLIISYPKTWRVSNLLSVFKLLVLVQRAWNQISFYFIFFYTMLLWKPTFLFFYTLVEVNNFKYFFYIQYKNQVFNYSNIISLDKNTS